jgi:hypothetical protein
VNSLQLKLDVIFIVLFMVCRIHINIIDTNILQHVVNARSAEGALSAEAADGSM